MDRISKIQRKFPGHKMRKEGLETFGKETEGAKGYKGREAVESHALPHLEVTRLIEKESSTVFLSLPS